MEPRAGCYGDYGNLLGYWWTTERVKIGMYFSMPSQTLVRTTHPGEKNRAEPEVVCKLLKGDTVKISHPPVPVGNRNWWVPIYGGDLVED
jgi:hypothetical protein